MEVDRKPKLYVVHCIDTEGPLEEDIEATFERLRTAKGIDFEPSQALLQKLQNREIDLGGQEKEVADYIAPKRLAYLTRWADVEEMVGRVTSRAFRQDNADPAGNPYTFTWFIVDVVGYRDNPRRKAVGCHTIWNQYQRFLKHRTFNDALAWHFHTVPIGNHALHYNTCWTNNDWPERVLARRVIEKNWFPSIFRAGGHIERNDLSLWLEQFIPFDYSSCSLPDGGGRPGSLSDWRQTPLTWSPYHPDFYDYRRPGQMNRWLFRCLDVDSNYCRLTQPEVEAAFRRVSNGKNAVLAYSSHDRRDLRPEIEKVRRLILDASEKFPDVAWEYTNAHKAARLACGLPDDPPPQFTIQRKGTTIFIRSDKPLFGPQPFLALQEDGDVFYRDNTTMEAENSWAYRLVRPETTKCIGVAGANKAGVVGTSTLPLC